MRISTNMISGIAINQVENLDGNVSKLQTQVSTGQRVSRPEDDPTAVGQLVNLQARQQTLAQYQQNASTALQISQTSTSALTDLKSVSDRASEIATLGSSTESASEAAAYGTETNQLLEQAVQMANTSVSGSYQQVGGARLGTYPSNSRSRISTMGVIAAAN